MKLNPWSNAVADGPSAPVGGTAYVSLNTGFIAKAYKETKAGLDPYRHGREIGLKSPSGTPILVNPALPFIELVEANHAFQVGHANSVMMHALAELETDELADLSDGAMKAAIDSKLAAAKYAAEQQAKPAVERRNDEYHKLTDFEICEGQERLSEGAYDEQGTLFKQFLLLVLVIVPDAFFNAFTFASAMPQGLMQALATAFFGSMAMAACGVTLGTGLRYFNYRRHQLQRNLWRSVTVISAVAALAIAAFLAQYRALLEVMASDASDSTSYSVLTAPLSIVELPVFVGCIIVLALAVYKFRGGPGTPWAYHANHAAYDLAYLKADREVKFLDEEFARDSEQICADGINVLMEANERQREDLKAGKAACGKAKLKINDLRSSHLAYVRAAEPDIAASFIGLRSARPDLEPEDFPEVKLPGAEDFPDPSELDTAVARAESAFGRRTEQLAELQKTLAALATKAREEFSRFLTKAIRREEDRPKPIRPLPTQPRGGSR